MNVSLSNLEDTLCNIVIEQQKKTVRKSSKIKEWLGREVSQSTVIKLGTLLEDLFNSYLIYSGKSMLHTLNDCKGKRCVQDEDGNNHQVDIYAQIDDKTYATFEMKCNLDLDRGKKRDVIRREETIFNALSKQLDDDVDIISGIFNPFHYEEEPKELFWEGTSIYLYGLPWIIDNLDLPFSMEDFIELGKSEQLKECLELIT